MPTMQTTAGTLCELSIVMNRISQPMIQPVKSAKGCGHIRRSLLYCKTNIPPAKVTVLHIQPYPDGFPYIYSQYVLPFVIPAIYAAIIFLFPSRHF